MHITFLLKKHPASLAGGAQKQTLYMAQGLADRGWRVSFVSEAAPPPVTAPPGDTITLPSRKNNYWSLFNVPATIRALHQLGPDVVYHRVSGIYTLPGAYAAHAVGAKFVWAVASDQDCTGRKYRDKPRPETLKGRIRYGLDTALDWSIQQGGQRTDLIVCQTAAQEQLVTQRFPSVPTTVVPNGITLREREDGGSPGGVKSSVLWVGKPAPVKRPWLFSELAHRCTDMEVPFRMAGIGRPDALKDGVDGTRCEIPPRLELLGQLEREAMVREYERSQIVVCTSRTEGFPNVFLEAWRAGCPVLSLWRDAGGILTQEKVGWYARDVDDAEQILRDVMASPDMLKRAGARAQTLVERRFRVDRCVNRLESALLVLLNDSSE